jgi:hypothetical protein
MHCLSEAMTGPNGGENDQPVQAGEGQDDVDVDDPRGDPLDPKVPHSPPDAGQRDVARRDAAHRDDGRLKVIFDENKMAGWSTGESSLDESQHPQQDDTRKRQKIQQLTR